MTDWLLVPSCCAGIGEQRRRVKPDALYGPDGQTLDAVEVVGEVLGDRRRPIFNARPG